MLRALQLVLFPYAAWTRITERPRSVLWDFLLSTAPLMAAGALVEGRSLAVWGKSLGYFGRVVHFSAQGAIRFELAQALLNFAAILLAALLLKMAAGGFSFEAPFSRAFLTFAYGFAGIFLSWFLDAIPAMNHWAAYGIGVALSTGGIYHGVGLALKPPQTKGFGLFLLAMINLIAAAALAHAAAWSWAIRLR